MKRLLRCVGWALLLGAPAEAARSVDPVVAIHPLVVLEGDAAQEVQLRKVFDADLAARNIPLASAACVKGFLVSVPKASCSAAEEACLAKLAHACGAQRVIFVAALPYPKRLVLSGKVVREDGFIERVVSGVEVRLRDPRTRGEGIRRGIQRFLTDDLKVDSLELQPLVPEPEPVATPEPVPGPAMRPGPVGGLAAPAPVASTPALRVVGFTSAGLAAASLVAGGAVWLSSHGDRSELQGRLNPDGSIPAGDVRAQQLDASLDRRGNWTAGLLIGAGAMAVTSVTTLLLGGRGHAQPETAPRVSVSASPTDISAGVSGAF